MVLFLQSVNFSLIFQEGKLTGAPNENEKIKLKLVPFDHDIVRTTPDAKLLCALQLYTHLYGPLPKVQ